MVIEIEKVNGDTIMRIEIQNDKIVKFENCEIADIKDNGVIRLQQIEEVM